jgi:lipoprotein-anchoring transpeptidase ErfK/SrfK
MAMAVAGAVMLAACSSTVESGSQPPPAAPATSPAAALIADTATTAAPVTVGPPAGTSTPATSTPATSTPATSKPATSTPATNKPATSTPAATSRSKATSSSHSSSSAVASTSTGPAPTPATISASPEFGTDNANPIEPLTLKVAGGRIVALAVYAADGSTIKGAVSADKTSWTSDQRLRYGGTYHAKGTATGQPGSEPTTIDGTWQTLDSYTQTTQIFPGDGAVVGVAAPVIIRFGTCEADHAKVEKHVTVTTTPKVAVRGTWVQHDGDECRSLDVRPETFWPEGTKVHVEVDLLGVQVAEDVYGARDVAERNFTIGRNRVTYADPKSKMLTVKEDGAVVAKYPTSMGRGDDVADPRMVTRSGIHVVIGKEADKKMTNEKFGYKDLPEPWSVRISNNGEYIHQNMDTIDVQGKQNVSHGCLNLSDVNAKQYFTKAIYGDPVVITGTSVKLSALDGDLYDWAIDWSEWRSLSSQD